MSLPTPGGNQAVVVRSVDAELVGGPPSTIQLLADASHTGGALATQRVTLTTAPPPGEVKRVEPPK